MSSERIEKAIRFLEDHDIAYERYDHPAVYTVEQVTELVRIDRGQRTKNLFVRDKKARNHVLIVVPHDIEVDLMELGRQTQLGRLSFASERRLMTYLGVEPGSVTLMGIINDEELVVDVILDRRIWEADSVRCHPLENTSTVILEADGLRRLFEATGHQPRIMEVPRAC